MKLDFTKIHEVTSNETHQTPLGGLQLRCTDQQAAIYVTGYGVEVLAGIGSCDCVFPEDAEATFRVDAKEGARAYLTLVNRQEYHPVGERFTNADRRPHESGSMQEVNSALRMFKLEQHRTISAMRAERKALEAARASTPKEQAAKPDGSDPDAISASLVDQEGQLAPGSSDIGSDPAQ